MMQPPVSHGRLFLIKLMETFPDILPKQAVAHTHPVTPAGGLWKRVSPRYSYPSFLLTAVVIFSPRCPLDKLRFTAWWG